MTPVWWADLATWWMEPAARASAQVLSYGPERILVELVDGVVHRFGDGSVEFSVRGRPGKAKLDWLRLLTRDGRHEVHLQLREVELDGFGFDRLAAVVHSVELVPGRQPQLTLDGIQISGRAPLESLVGWVEGRTGDWALAIDDAGGVTACHRSLDLTAEVELSVDDDELQMDLRALRWRRHRLPVPGWLRLRRTVATLHLAPGLTVAEARRRGSGIDFDLRMESIKQTFELAQLRDAVLRGGRIPVP